MNEISDIVTLSPPLLLALVLNGVGVFLKKSPVVDWLIPFILVVLGAAIYPFIGLGEGGTVRQAMVGAAIGVMSVGMHQAARQFFARKTATGETHFIKRAEKVTEESKP